MDFIKLHNILRSLKTIAAKEMEEYMCGFLVQIISTNVTVRLLKLLPFVE